MLGRSGAFYRAGYLCRQANDWPDGSDEQTGMMPEDVEMQAGPDSSTAQQKTSAAPAEQGDVSGVAAQSSGSELQEPRQIFAFTAPWRMPATTDVSPTHVEGAETGTGQFRLPPAPTSSLAGLYGRQTRQNPMSSDTSQPVRGNDWHDFKAPSLFSATTPNAPLSFIPTQANTGADRQAPPNQFNAPSLFSPSFLNSLRGQAHQDTSNSRGLQPLGESATGRSSVSPVFLGSSIGSSDAYSNNLARNFPAPGTMNSQPFMQGDSGQSQQGVPGFGTQPVQRPQQGRENGNTFPNVSKPTTVQKGAALRPHLDQSITVGPHQNEQVDSLHSGITSMAGAFEGSTAYLESNRTKMGAGSNKCNEFVGDMIQAGGFPRPQVRYTDYKGILHLTRDPSAKEWATATIPGYSAPLPLSEARPGDIIAMGHHDDYEGHVGIYMGNGMVASVNAKTNPPGIVTVNDWGFRGLGQNDEHQGDNPPVVRRWIGGKRK